RTCLAEPARDASRAQAAQLWVRGILRGGCRPDRGGAKRPGGVRGEPLGWWPSPHLLPPVRRRVRRGLVASVRPPRPRPAADGRIPHGRRLAGLGAARRQRAAVPRRGGLVRTQGLWLSSDVEGTVALRTETIFLHGFVLPMFSA